MRWVFGSHGKKIFFIVSMVVVGQAPALFSMYRSPQYGGGGDREWRRAFAAKERYEHTKLLNEEKRRKQEELAAILSFIESDEHKERQSTSNGLMASIRSFWRSDPDVSSPENQESAEQQSSERKKLSPLNEQRKQQLEAEIRDIDATLAQYRNSIKSDPYGKLIALALAGEDYEMIGDAPIDSVLDGFEKGITLRATRALSDVVNKKVGMFVNDTLGATWDSMYKTCKSYSGKIWSLLFHHSHEPFTASELDGWSELILSCLDDFAKLVKGRMEVEARSRDMTSRSFDNNDDQNAINQDQLVWESIVNGYAEQIDYFVEAIRRRMRYYKDEAIETFYGNQLCNRLLAFKNIILSTRSLKDLSAKLGSNATLLIAMNNNIKKLFKKLSDEVRPLSDSGNQNTQQNQMSNDYASQRRRYVGQDEYPLGFDDNYGSYNGL